MYCRNCGKEMVEGAAVCTNCGVAAGNGTAYCPNCGAETVPGAAVCTNCGTALSAAVSGEAKSKMTAGLLGIFLGGFGVHRFYLGYTGIGIAQIAVTLCTLGAGAIWGVIEGILILVGKIDKDAKGNPLKD
ncbi:MAG: TM2 domain-containing protein [Clostridia bacterium]|nr:TM2 domain-containing protein [Clostridia bacterium]